VTAPRGRARPACALLAAAVALAAALLPTTTLAQDETAVRRLAEGREALERGDVEGAVESLRAAVEGNPTPTGARYWLARALESAGERAEALREFRRFEAAILDGAHEPGGDEAVWLDEVRERTLALSAVETAHRKATAAFVAECLAIAAKAQGDEDLERRALRAVLVAAPLNTDAAGRIAALGAADPRGALAAPGGSHVPRWVTTWTNLLEDGSFGEPAREARRLALDETALLTRAGRTLATGARYVVDVELRVAASAKPGWICGVSFGAGGAYSVCFDGTRIFLDESVGERLVVLGTGEHGQAALGTWVRLTLVADGDKVDVWVNGQPCLRAVATSRAGLDGDLALVRRNCGAEARSLLLGLGS